MTHQLNRWFYWRNGAEAVNGTDELQRAARISLMKLLGGLSVQERQLIQRKFGVLLCDPPTSDELDALAKISFEDIEAPERDVLCRMQR